STTTLLSSSLATPPSWFSTLSLHDALPIFLLQLSSENSPIIIRIFFPFFWFNFFHNFILDRFNKIVVLFFVVKVDTKFTQITQRSEEHTSELQSRFDLVCRLLLEKKDIVYH